MRRLSDLTGMPVLTLENGRQIGMVEEVLVSLEAALLQGIVVRDTVWFSDRRWISFADMHHIGVDAVMVRDAAAVTPFHREEAGGARVSALRDLTEKSIFSEMGAYLGTLADLLFDPATGKLKAFEVSDGLIGDLLYGRARLPLPPVQAVCEDRMIIPESMTKLLHY